MQNILKCESNLGAKLLDYAVSERIEICITQCNRLRVEVLVLQEYYEEMKLYQKTELIEQQTTKLKINRKRLELPQDEKLHISYLVSLRGMLQESSVSFQRLKILSTEDQLRITA